MTRKQTNNKNEYDQVATSSPRNDNTTNNQSRCSLCSIVSLVVLCLGTTLGIYFVRTYYHPQQWNSSNSNDAAAAASAGSAAAAAITEEEEEASLYDPTLNNTTSTSSPNNNDKSKKDDKNSSETTTSSSSSSTDPTTTTSSSSFDWIEEEMSHHSVDENNDKDNDNDIYDNDPTILKVHLVPHTHDDVGWLKTVEQYFYGYNNTIQHACVKCILDTTIRALAEDSRRKFTWVEISFFEMWYNEQSPQIKELVKHLVLEAKQFVFVNGGWCMHDEATTYYIGMIDQTTRGHVFLHDTFDGYTPHVGWQLDPFGHSSTQAKYMTSEMGFDSLFVGRIDHQDLDLRLQTSQCEGIWKASSDQSDDTQIFWSKTGSYDGVYGPPNGFKFDSTFKDEYEPVVMIDDFSGNKVGNPTRLEEFLERVMWQASHTQGTHIMLTMGSDFWYENAHENYERLDELIYWMNDFSSQGKFPQDKMGSYSKIKVFYSDPSTYTKAKYHEQQQLQQRSSSSNSPAPVSYDVKTDDFFPYSSNDHSYWTGFFTSRPSLKRFERVTSGFLHAARQVEALDDLQSRSLAIPASPTSSPLDSLEDSVSILQHHDGVTGTSKQHVANDYVKRTYSGWRKASQYMAHKLLATMKPYLDLQRPSELIYCPSVYNESKCVIPQTLTTEERLSSNNNSNRFYVVAYNALAYTRNETLRIPVMTDRIEQYQIFDSDQNLMNFTIFPNINNDLVFGLDDNNDESLMTAPYHLYLEAINLRPLQATTFFIQFLLKEETTTSKQQTKEGTTHDLRRQLTHDRRHLLRRGKPSDSISRRQLGSHHHNHNKNKNKENVKADDDDDDSYYNSDNKEVTNGEEDTIDMKEEEPAAMPENIENPLERIMNQFSIEIGYYKSYASDDKHEQNSGAYIFRPDGDFVVITPEEPPVFYSSDFVSEVHQRVNSWIRYVVRAKQGVPYLEVEYTVGPIPVTDHIGKEIIVRYKSLDIENNGVFYTDSNGREFQRRQVSYRPTWTLGKEHEPVAGNYYPINSAIYIEDSAQTKSMAVVTDRSHGGTSIQDGTIEIMVHRRMLLDDHFGVEEALDETYDKTESYPPYGKGQRHVGSGKGLIVQGTHRVYLSEVYGGATLARSGMDDMFSPIQLFFGQSTSSIPTPSNEQTTTNNKLSVTNILPSNLMLVTFMKWPFFNSFSTNPHTSTTLTKKTYLVRIGHQYATGEDSELSNVEYYDMTWLFGNVTLSETTKVIHMEERTLSGNQLRSTWESKRLSWIGTPSSDEPSAAAAPTIETSTACTINNNSTSPSSTLFQIQPMKICTFAVTVEIKTN